MEKKAQIYLIEQKLEGLRNEYQKPESDKKTLELQAKFLKHGLRKLGVEPERSV